MLGTGDLVCEHSPETNESLHILYSGFPECLRTCTADLIVYRVCAMGRLLYRFRVRSGSILVNSRTFADGASGLVKLVNCKLRRGADNGTQAYVNHGYT